jgi:hypothetical protein
LSSCSRDLLDAFFLFSMVCQLKLLGLVMSEITDKLAMVITISCVGIYAFFSTGGPLLEFLEIL